jgi:hypothetical protein
MRKEAHRWYEEGSLERCQILHTYCQKVVRALWGLVWNTKEMISLKQQTTTNVPNFSQIWKVVITFFSTILSSFIYITTYFLCSCPFLHQLPVALTVTTSRSTLGARLVPRESAGRSSQITLPCGRQLDGLRSRYFTDWTTSEYEGRKDDWPPIEAFTWSPVKYFLHLIFCWPCIIMYHSNVSLCITVT